MVEAEADKNHIHFQEEINVIQSLWVLQERLQLLEKRGVRVIKIQELVQEVQEGQEEYLVILIMEKVETEVKEGEWTRIILLFMGVL